MQIYIKEEENCLIMGKYIQNFQDPVVKSHFYKLNREYSKLRKYKYKQYRQSLIDKLDSLHEENPKLYWTSGKKWKKWHLCCTIINFRITLQNFV